MTRKLHDVPIEKIAVEHYLFDINQSIETTAKIFGEDEEYVRKIYDDYMRFIMPGRRNK